MRVALPRHDAQRHPPMVRDEELRKSKQGTPLPGDLTLRSGPTRVRAGGRMKKVLWVAAFAVPFIAVLSVVAQERGRGRGGSVTLPDGPGREIVQAQCASCHGLNLITNSGYARDEWISVFSTMVALPQDQASTVADYLAKNFPEKPRPRAVIVPGNTNVNIREWIV